MNTIDILEFTEQRTKELEAKVDKLVSQPHVNLNDVLELLFELDILEDIIKTVTEGVNKNEVN